MKRLITLTLFLTVVAPSAFAEPVVSNAGQRHGLITSSSCPYSCRDAGLAADVCRETRIGDTCQVEDLTQAPGHRTLLRVPKTAMLDIGTPAASSAPRGDRRGLVTSAACPYTCKDAGLTAADCDERRIGDTCQVEDFTQAPGHRSMVRVE